MKKKTSKKNKENASKKLNEKIKKKADGFDEMEAKTVAIIEYSFTPEDMVQKRDELVAAFKEKTNLEIKKSAMNKEFGDKIKVQDDIITKTVEAIEMRKEKREVECTVKYNWTKGEKYIIHPQTGEVIYTYGLDLFDDKLRKEFEESKKKGKVKEPEKIKIDEKSDEEIAAEKISAEKKQKEKEEKKEK